MVKWVREKVCGGLPIPVFVMVVACIAIATARWANGIVDRETKRQVLKDAGNEPEVIKGAMTLDYFVDTHGEKEGFEKFSEWYMAEENRRRIESVEKTVIYQGGKWDIMKGVREDDDKEIVFVSP